MLGLAAADHHISAVCHQHTSALPGSHILSRLWKGNPTTKPTVLYIEGK